MRVIHVAPSVFGPDGLYGGGERYPLELARVLADQVDCELVTFGPQPATWRADGGLRVRVLRPVTWLHGHPAQPVAPLLPAALTRAQVVHAHHFRSVPRGCRRSRPAFSGWARRSPITGCSAGPGAGSRTG